jgi:hypothetical protein
MDYIQGYESIEKITMQIRVIFPERLDILDYKLKKYPHKIVSTLPKMV